MIVIAGGSGRLGRILVEKFRASGEPVRVLSRSPERVHWPAGGGVEVVRGDVRDGEAVGRAVAGARVVISAMSAFGMTGVEPRAVDLAGNLALIAAAEQHGIEKFIFVSVLRASPEHPMELGRLKYLAEQRLTASKLTWTILRPSTFTETFQEALCAPLMGRSGKAIVFGRAQNPVNFVSAHDVARFVQLAATAPLLAGTALDIGGPANLSLLEFVAAFQSTLGLSGQVRHIPRLALKALSQLARPFNPRFARMAGAGAVMDSTDMSFDPAGLIRQFPEISLTTVAASALRDYGGRAAAQAVAS